MGEITEEMIRENPEEWERLKGIMKEMAKILKERKSRESGVSRNEIL